jgi:hypothetical protein
MEMSKHELINKLAQLGCQYIKAEGMTVQNLANYGEACTKIFMLAPEERREVMGKLVHFTIEKEQAA